MPNLVHVVVQDPGLKRLPGYIIPNPRELAAYQLRGVVVLPIDDDLAPSPTSSALDGFFIKQWGAGWIANKGAGERCCPMMINIHPQRNYLHWVARVVPVTGMRGTGRIRLTGDSSQSGFLSAGVAHVQAPDLLENTPLDEVGGWTIRGVSLINVLDRGVLALALHAVARNVRILWSAVALSSQGTER